MRHALQWLRRHPFVVVPFLLYAATAHRTIGLPDSAVAIEAMSGPALSAVAYNHNLHNLIGWLFQHLVPVGDVVWRSSLTAAFYGGAAVALFYFIMISLGAARRWAAGCASVFMVSHSMWWHATTPENYALSLVFAEIVLLLALREGRAPPEDRGRVGRLAWMCFAAGFSLFNHVQNGAICLAAAAVALSGARRLGRSRGRALAICALAGLAGACPYLLVLIRDTIGGPFDVRTLSQVAGGGFTSLMFHYDWAAIPRLADWILLQFPSPFLLLLPAGLGWSLFAPAAPPGSPRPPPAATRQYRMALWIWMGVTFAFFAGYTTWDQFSFYLPVFAGLALMGSEALVLMVQSPRSGRRRWLAAALAVSIAIPPLVYPMIRHCAERKEGVWGRRYAAISSQYAGRYDLVGMLTDPASHDRGTTERFIRRLLDRLPPDSVFIDDMSTYYQIEFLRRREGRRPDLHIEVVAGGPMEDHALDVDALLDRWRASTNRIFIVTDGGLTGRLADRLAETGRRRQRFDLGDGLRVIECARPPE